MKIKKYLSCHHLLVVDLFDFKKMLFPFRIFQGTLALLVHRQIRASCKEGEPQPVQKAKNQPHRVVIQAVTLFGDGEFTWPNLKGLKTWPPRKLGDGKGHGLNHLVDFCVGSQFFFCLRGPLRPLHETALWTSRSKLLYTWEIRWSYPQSLRQSMVHHLSNWARVKGP